MQAILSKIAEFLSTSEDAMWDMMEYPEFCIIDERPNGEKHGYFCQNSYKTFGTTIINILYVKTVVVKAPGKEVYRNNNEPLFVYKNGKKQNKKKVGTLCVLTFLNVFI